MNKLGYLAYYGVPFAKETISFLLIELPYSPSRDLQGLNWLSSVKPSKLERLVSSRFGKNMYDSKLSFDVQGIPSIPSSAKYYAISFLYTNQAHLYYDLTVKNVLPLGDLLSFYTFYLVFSSEESLDEKIAWAAITVLELHSPNTAHSLKQDFQRSKLTQPSDSQVDKIIKEWSPYIPKPGEGKFIYARFDSDIKPYVLSELAMKLKKLETN